MKKLKKLYLQAKRRFRKRIIGTAERPRLSVFRSHKHIYAQLIDDKNGQTLAAFSTLSSNEKPIKGTTRKAAFTVGHYLAHKAKSKNISLAVFDRGNKVYHGRVKSLADGCRDQGLAF